MFPRLVVSVIGALWLIYLPLCHTSPAEQDIHDPYIRFVATLLGEQHVLSTFRSVRYLTTSLRLEQERDMTLSVHDVLAKRHRATCFQYENGQAFANAARALYGSNDITPAHPTLVDYEGNVMCFSIKTSDSERKQLQLESIINKFGSFFDQPIPTPLKIHHSLYDTVHALALHEVACNNATHLTISLRNLTIGAGNTSSGMSYELKEKLGYLTRYDLKYLHEFFWTSPRSNAFLTAGPKDKPMSAEESADQERMLLWFNLGQALEYKLQELKFLKLTDPCKFKDIKIEQFEHKITLSVKHLLNYFANAEEESIEAACLVYLSTVFAEDPSVVLISLSSQPELLLIRARSIVQTNTLGNDATSMPYSEIGLLGTNQIVSLADTGLDSTNCYFSDTSGDVQHSSLSQPVFDPSRRKVIGYCGYSASCDYTDEVDGHGTHVAGIIAGQAENSNLATNTIGQFNGVAPNAKLVVLDVGDVGGGLYVCSADCLYSPGYTAGARIHTNSWGSPFVGTGHYTGSDADLWLYNHPDMIILFAAGNSGTNGAGSVTMESSSKNVISVGAAETTLDSLNIHNLAWYSSLGPSYDGRIKPDIVAPGDSIIAAASNYKQGPSCGTVEKSGTSMASPSAAGAAALIRQYFIDETFLFWSAICNGQYANCKSFSPSGVLVKAVILHSGQSMQQYWVGDTLSSLGAPPDFKQGYGLINLSNVLPLKVANTFDLFVDDLRSIGQNAMITYTVTVANSAFPLKITLSWYDYPNIEGFTGSALINDLNLEVVSLTANSRYHGNMGSSADKLNNNEQVFIANPTVGDWQVAISTNALPHQGSQLFSVAITCGGSVTAH